eukprot:scaffold19441_cov129-Isochrysis_galbana.AAC.7
MTSSQTSWRRFRTEPGRPPFLGGFTPSPALDPPGVRVVRKLCAACGSIEEALRGSVGRV